MLLLKQQGRVGVLRTELIGTRDFYAAAPRGASHAGFLCWSCVPRCTRRCLARLNLFYFNEPFWLGNLPLCRPENHYSVCAGAAVAFVARSNPA